MRSNSEKLLRPALVLAFILLAGWTANTRTASGTAADDAKTIYAAKCAICHAADGSGNTAKGKELKLRDLRSPEVQKLTDEKLLSIIGKGVKKMPGYEKSLGKDKVQLLVTYTRELAKKK